MINWTQKIALEIEFFAREGRYISSTVEGALHQARAQGYAAGIAAAGDEVHETVNGGMSACCAEVLFSVRKKISQLTDTPDMSDGDGGDDGTQTGSY